MVSGPAEMTSTRSGEEVTGIPSPADREGSLPEHQSISLWARAYAVSSARPEQPSLLTARAL
jgi:hypothetical protein